MKEFFVAHKTTETKKAHPLMVHPVLPPIQIESPLEGKELEKQIIAEIARRSNCEPEDVELLGFSEGKN